jgi:hypothetical protein
MIDLETAAQITALNMVVAALINAHHDHQQLDRLLVQQYTNAKQQLSPEGDQLLVKSLQLWQRQLRHNQK